MHETKQYCWMIGLPCRKSQQQSPGLCLHVVHELDRLLDGLGHRDVVQWYLVSLESRYGTCTDLPPAASQEQSRVV